MHGRTATSDYWSVPGFSHWDFLHHRSSKIFEGSSPSNFRTMSCLWNNRPLIISQYDVQRLIELWWSVCLLLHLFLWFGHWFFPLFCVWLGSLPLVITYGINWRSWWSKIVLLTGHRRLILLVRLKSRQEGWILSRVILISLANALRCCISMK